MAHVTGAGPVETTLEASAEPGPVGPGERSAPLAVGVMIWLASELMFFAGLFAAWFVLRAEGGADWPPSDVELDIPRAAIATAVLVLSSFTIHAAVVASERGRLAQARRLLFVTMALGTLFIANLLSEYYGLGFGFDNHAYGTIFYLLTGFHGAHLVGGLVAMGLLAWVIFSAGSRTPPTQTLRVISFYWHFVDAVWVVLFTVVYLIG
jgi:cytochrome c oxidase subunit 3